MRNRIFANAKTKAQISCAVVGPILEILFLLFTVHLKSTQIQGDSLDRIGFGCSEGLDH